MIIGNDVMWNIGVNICYSSESIKCNNDSIPLKSHWTIQNSYMNETIYNIHTVSTIIKEAEEHQKLVLDADNLKVDIPSMILNLNITDKLKAKLQANLGKFLNLVGGGLGKLAKFKSDKIKFKKKDQHCTPENTIISLKRVWNLAVRRSKKWLILEFYGLYLSIMTVLCVLHYLESWRKQMTFRIVTSFWKINECIKWHPIPLPRIMDQLQQLERKTRCLLMPTNRRCKGNYTKMFKQFTGKDPSNYHNLKWQTKNFQQFYSRWETNWKNDRAPMDIFWSKFKDSTVAVEVNFKDSSVAKINIFYWMPKVPNYKVGLLKIRKT